MNFFQHHVFFCCNQREGGKPCCNDHGASEVREYAKSRIKALGLSGAGRVRINMAGCLDRLHVIVAPIIMGSGRAGFSLPAIEHMDQAVRIKMHAHALEDEMLFDCDLSAQRVKLV